MNQLNTEERVRRLERLILLIMMNMPGLFPDEPETEPLRRQITANKFRNRES